MDGRPLEDPELISRGRAGDSTAFGQLVQKYQEIAFRTAFLIVGEAAEAEDATQEAFVKAYYALDRFRPEAAFRPGCCRSWPIPPGTAGAQWVDERNWRFGRPRRPPRGTLPRPPR
jgi:hypothetical protein